MLTERWGGAAASGVGAKRVTFHPMHERTGLPLFPRVTDHAAGRDDRLAAQGLQEAGAFIAEMSLYRSGHQSIGRLPAAGFRIPATSSRGKCI